MLDYRFAEGNCFAQRDGQGSLSIVLDVYVPVFDPNGDLAAECGDGGFVDPTLMEEFADDLSYVFIIGDGGHIGLGNGPRRPDTTQSESIDSLASTNVCTTFDEI